MIKHIFLGATFYKYFATGREPDALPDKLGAAPAQQSTFRGR
jgi:hypothetical protein